MRALPIFLFVVFLIVGCDSILSDRNGESDTLPDPFTEFLGFRYAPNDTVGALRDIEITIVLDDSVNEHIYKWRLPETVSTRTFTTRQPSFLFNAGTVTGTFSGSVEVIPIINVGDLDPVNASYTITVVDSSAIAQ